MSEIEAFVSDRLEDMIGFMRSTQALLSPYRVVGNAWSPDMLDSVMTALQVSIFV